MWIRGHMRNVYTEQGSTERILCQSPAPRLLNDVGIKHTLLLEIVRNCILREKRRLKPDFGSDPFALGVGNVRCVIAAPATAKLRAEVGALNLVKLVNLTPGSVADGSGYINLQSYNRHAKG